MNLPLMVSNPDSMEMIGYLCIITSI